MWYAVERDSTDNDWGYGSYDLDEAKQMARKMGKEAVIAVIDEDEEYGGECKAVIKQEDF